MVGTENVYGGMARNELRLCRYHVDQLQKSLGWGSGGDGGKSGEQTQGLGKTREL